MSLDDQPSRKRVSVQKKASCFVVAVDSQPVLRCAAHQDALRYAVIVRRALERARRSRGEGVSPARTVGPKHEVSPARHAPH